MLSKWFICAKQKSKGYFIRLTNSSYMSRNYPQKTDTTASFTRQTALARGYNTKEEAEEALDKIRLDIQNTLEKYTENLRNLLDLQQLWPRLTLDEQIKALKKHDIILVYKDKNNWGQSTNRHMIIDKPITKLTDVQKAVITGTTFDDGIDASKHHIEVANNQLEYIKKNLVVREETIEIKFLGGARRTVQWTIRKDSDTSRSYCNCCGGAVPSIPQLIIGEGWKYETIICAICMSKLAEEAKIQAGKIDDEILEQYNTDRFLRSM